MSDVVNIGVLGATGRMGQAVIEAIHAHDKTTLSAALARPGSTHIGTQVKNADIFYTDDVKAGLDACDILIDFSSPQAAIDAVLAMHGTRCQTCVTGTTGFTPTDAAALEEAASHITLLRSGNFSLGISMLEALVEIAAARLSLDWDIEVLEMHHRHKKDAPSGTALMLGEAAARGRDVDLKDVRVLDRTSCLTEREAGQIGFGVLRGGGVIGDHDVCLSSPSEMITLSHRAFERSLFAQGAVTAALWAYAQPKGLYTMRDVIGIPAQLS